MVPMQLTIFQRLWKATEILQRSSLVRGAKTTGARTSHSTWKTSRMMECRVVLPIKWFHVISYIEHSSADSWKGF